MAKSKRKAYIKDTFGGKTRRKSGLGLLFRILMSTPIRQLILVALIVAVLFWQRQNIADAGEKLVELFGWGLVFIAAAVVILVVQIWRRKLSLFIYRWNRWLGSIAFILAIWGILAFSDLGGKFGQSIISYPAHEIIGALRISGLVILGIILVTPVACFRLTAKFFAWLGNQFKRRPATRPIGGEPKPPLYHISRNRPSLTEKPPLPSDMLKPIMPPEMATTKPPLVVSAKETTTPEPAPPPPATASSLPSC